MTTVTFELSDAQVAEAQKILDERNKDKGSEDNPFLTLDSLCKLEAVHALGLNDVQLLEKEKAEIAAKFEFFTEEQRAAVKAIVQEAKLAEVAKLEEATGIAEISIKGK